MVFVLSGGYGCSDGTRLLSVCFEVGEFVCLRGWVRVCYYRRGRVIYDLSCFFISAGVWDKELGF